MPEREWPHHGPKERMWSKPILVVSRFGLQIASDVLHPGTYLKASRAREVFERCSVEGVQPQELPLTLAERRVEVRSEAANWRIREREFDHDVSSHSRTLTKCGYWLDDMFKHTNADHDVEPV